MANPAMPAGLLQPTRCSHLQESLQSYVMAQEKGLMVFVGGSSLCLKSVQYFQERPLNLDLLEHQRL